MKKFLFSVLACVAFAGSSFASNEMVVEKNLLLAEFTLTNSEEISKLISFDYPCRFLIYVYDPETNEEIDHLMYFGRESKDDCFQAGLDLQEDYAKKYPGANVSMRIIT